MKNIDLHNFISQTPPTPVFEIEICSTKKNLTCVCVCEMRVSANKRVWNFNPFELLKATSK